MRTYSSFLFVMMLFFSASKAFAILGGELVAIADPLAKSTVVLITQQHNFCGGVILSPNLIVSAAHCLSKSPEGDYTVGPNDYFLDLFR